MRSTAMAAVLGVLVVATFAAGGRKEIDFGPSGAPNSMPRVAETSPDSATKKLLDDLGSDDWRTREKAGQELTKLGEKALPHMRKAMLATDNPEVQQRLSVLVRRMDRQRLTEPKRITLKMKDKTAKEIFDEICKQTGYRIEYVGNGGREGKYSFDFDNKPFWQALDAVASAGGLTIQTEYNDDSLRVYRQEVINPYIAYSGPFRLLPTNISSNRNVQLSGISRHGNGGNASEYMSLSMQIQSEPKNPMLSVGQPEIIEAKDENGGSLAPPRDRNNNHNSYYSGYIDNYRGHNSYINVNLVRVDRNATKIAKLKGRVNVVLLAGTTPDVVVTDVLKAKKKTVVGRGAQMEFDNITEAPNQKGVYQVTFSAKRLGPSDPNRNEDYMWMNTLWQRLELSDEKGNRYYCYGPIAQNNNGPGSGTWTVQFGSDDRRGRANANKPGPPVKFAIVEWLTATHEVTFEFKDIPLP